jgi:hypothetical protein
VSTLVKDGQEIPAKTDQVPGIFSHTSAVVIIGDELLSGKVLF